MYKLWTGRPPLNDVYIASRQLGSLFKVSLHQSGKWQVSFTSEHEKRMRSEGRWQRPSRHVSTWLRPPELSPGLTCAVKVYIPGSELCVIREAGTANKSAFWVPAPPVDHGVEFFVLLTRPGLVGRGWPGSAEAATQLAAQTQLPNGEMLWLVYNVRKITQAIWDRVAKHELAEVYVAHDSFVGPQNPNCRSLQLWEEDDGSRLFIETTSSTARALGHRARDANAT
jgi:hypothetical protein